MELIRSLDEPDPVQRYVRRQALLRGAALALVAVLLVLAVYWGVYR
jgi:hypothetical protein